MARHDYAHLRDAPLDTLTIADLTDALGIGTAADLLGVSRRQIYTVRSSDRLGVARIAKLIGAIRKDEAACRERLLIVRTQKARQEARKKDKTRA